MIDLILFNDFCKMINANPNTVKTWKRRGDLPAKIFFKIGGTLYILRDSFEDWVKERQAGLGEHYDNL